jgi:hypothetical protein
MNRNPNTNPNTNPVARHHQGMCADLATLSLAAITLKLEDSEMAVKVKSQFPGGKVCADTIDSGKAFDANKGPVEYEFDVYDESEAGLQACLSRITAGPASARKTGVPALAYHLNRLCKVDARNNAASAVLSGGDELDAAIRAARKIAKGAKSPEQRLAMAEALQAQIAALGITDLDEAEGESESESEEDEE